MKRLIVNADDFGLHENINDGIIQAHRHGCVTSTTLVAGGNAFEHAARLSEQYPTLGVGVHLTLVGSHPVSQRDIGSLLNRNGGFWDDYLTFTRHYLQGRINAAHIETELSCQLQKAVDHGINISHLDSHQHLHVLPGFPRIVSRLARKFGVAKIRIPAEPISLFYAPNRSWRKFLNRTLLTACARRTRSQYRCGGLQSPEHFFGMLSGGQTTEPALLSIIDQLPNGTSEIMVHPGRDNTQLNAVFHWNYHWQEELEALRSTVTLTRLQERDIQLINYWDL